MISSTVTPGSSLSPTQRNTIEFISRFQGRDIVIAIDTTQSVQINDEGILRLKQIVRDQLKSGDSIYVVPFSSELEIPLTPIEVKDQDQISQVIDTLPLTGDPNAANTDIQKAELKIYKHLAQLNQDRLVAKLPVKSQAVIWLTDAPLRNKTGNEWIETPSDSPFRNPNSLESIERAKWLEVIPLEPRSVSINNYKYTVVDIPATVQEFCTPAPSGQESCLVDSYLFSQLGLPSAIGVTTIVIVFALIGWRFWHTGGKLKLEIKTPDLDEPQGFELKNNQRIAIGEFNQSYAGSIDCPGAEIRGYLQRQGRNIYVVPSGIELSTSTSIYYGENTITSKHKISGRRISLNCPDHKDKEFLVEIVIDK